MVKNHQSLKCAEVHPHEKSFFGMPVFFCSPYSSRLFPRESTESMMKIAPIRENLTLIRVEMQKLLMTGKK